MVKNREMVLPSYCAKASKDLSVDDRRRIAAAYAIFARVDARRKAARRSRRKSKPNEERKPRSSAGLRGFLSSLVLPFI